MSTRTDRLGLARPRAVVGWAVLVGLAAGLIAATYFRIAGEPLIDEAIAIEDATAAAEAETEAHAGDAEDADHTAVDVHTDDSVEISRSTQRGAGLFGAYALLGMVFGLLLSVAALSLRGSWLDPLRRVLVAATILAASLTVVPWFKYPPNPPAVGDPDTAGRRQLLFLLLVVLTGLALAGAARLSARLRRAGWDDARRMVVVAAAAVGVLALLLLVLPANTDPIPEAVPASLIWRFRVASLAGNLLLWSLLAVGFGSLWAWATDRRAVRASGEAGGAGDAEADPPAGQNSMPFNAEIPLS